MLNAMLRSQGGQRDAAMRVSSVADTASSPERELMAYTDILGRGSRPTDQRSLISDGDLGFCELEVVWVDAEVLSDQPHVADGACP
jgi:hypothetical protein